jgi:hypothetical protein
VGKAAVRDKRAERIQALREQQAREARRKVTMSITAVAVAIAVVAVLVGVKLVTGSSSSNAAKSGAASAAVVADVTTVPAATFNTVGAGTASNKPIKLNGPPLTAGGLPRILYVGAEYCPYCASERWAVAAALARFGTWSKLGSTHSSTTDIYPNTATLSFHGATFVSPYVSFTGVEQTTNQQVNGQYVPLDKLSAADQAILQKYDAAPYVSSQNAGSIPFIDIGNKWMISGATFNPQILQGKTHEQIAAALKDPTSDISKAIIGSANLITAAICDVTKNAPTNVCTAPGVVAAAKVLHG